MSLVLLLLTENELKWIDFVLFLFFIFFVAFCLFWFLFSSFCEDWESSHFEMDSLASYIHCFRFLCSVFGVLSIFNMKTHYN